MNLPSTLRWIEVDHPEVIERKDASLRDETPACLVERFGLDLSASGARQQVFDRVRRVGTRALALTEGVIGYLSTDQVARLADELRTFPQCELWVTEYFSTRQLRAYQKHQPLLEAPVRFNPPDWKAFFTEHGWAVAEIGYLGERSQQLHRSVPLLLPIRDRLTGVFTSRILRDTGYALLEQTV